MIGFDDLPGWMQRLQDTAPATKPVRGAMAATRPAARIEPLNDRAAATPGDIVAPSRETSVDEAGDPDEVILRSESDLSLTRFAWIAGTAIVLIIAAVLVLFL
jgi:hypothetical protein